MVDNKVEEKKDYLRVDREVPGQRYYSVSFVEPVDNVFIDKEHYFFTRFMDLIQEQNESYDELFRDKGTGKWDMNKLKEQYQDWRTTKYDEWNQEFNDENKNRLSMRGLKVRGVYQTLDEAKERAEEVRLEDPTFHVFVAPVGYWVPFNPTNLDKLESVYQEEMLNDIVKENMQQKKKINKAFEDRKTGLITKAKKRVALDKIKKELQEKKLLEGNTSEMVSEVMDTQQDNVITQKQSDETEVI